MSSKEAQFQPNVIQECVQPRDRGFRLGAADSPRILAGGPTKQGGGFNMTDSSLRRRIVRSGSVLATALFLASGALSQDAPGAVYAMTNAGGNSILIFARAATGALASAGSAPTGYCMAHSARSFSMAAHSLMTPIPPG